jgi:hypothetical protein
MELWKTDLGRIADLRSLPDNSNDNCDADDHSHDVSEFGGAKGKPTLSLKQIGFTLKQFNKSVGQANYSAFNKWKKVWVAGCQK